MLLLLLSLSLGASRLCSLPSYQFPGDEGKAAIIGPSGSCAWEKFSAGDLNAVTDCGADNTGATYTDAAINACILALGPTGDPSGVSIYFPRGSYKLANTLNLTHRVIIHGDGSNSSFFYPDKSVTGITVQYPCENGHSPACDLPRSDGSVIENVGVFYNTQSSAWLPTNAYSLGDLAYGSTGPSNINYQVVFQVTTAGTSASTEPTWGGAAEGDFITDGGVTWNAIVVAGIRLNAHATIRNSYIGNSSGNGIHIQASTPAKNANSWYVDYVRTETSKLNGLFVQGADANAGQANMLNTGSNRLWGAYDISFLGNTYTACQADDNQAGAYAMLGAGAANVLTGCYSESGQPPSQLLGNSVSIGGLHGAGFTADSGAYRMSAGNYFETSGGGINFRDANAPSGAHTSMPWSSDYVINFTDNNEGSAGFTLQGETGAGNAGWWRWRHNNLDNRNFMSWAGVNSDAGPGNIWMPQGLYIGDRAYLDMRSGKPSWSGKPQSGGSFRFNTSQYTQSGFANGVFGWQQQGDNNTISQIVTIRWPHMGLSNEFDLTTAPSGTPHVVDWTDEAGVVYTDVGSSAKQYVTLPQSGFNPDLRTFEFSAVCQTSHGIRVTSTVHPFSFGSKVSAGGAYLESTTPGSWLKVKNTLANSGYVWNVVELTGTWTDGTNTYSNETQHLLVSVTAASGPTGSPATTGFIADTIVSQSVPAGNWTARGTACLHDATAGAADYGLTVAISDTNNSLGSSTPGVTQVSSVQSSTAGQQLLGIDACQTVGPTRISVGSSTTEYLVLRWNTSNAAHVNQIYGSLEFWRER